MRLAVLLQCHTKPYQINKLLEKLNSPFVDIYVHVDKKSEIDKELISRDNIFILPMENRVSVEWGGYSQVEATLKMIRIANHKKTYDYYWLISGQDFLLKSINEILSILDHSDQACFIDCIEGRQFEKRYEIYYPKWLVGREKYAKIARKMWIMMSGGPNSSFNVFKRRNRPIKKFYAGSQWWCLSGEFIGWMLQYLNQNPGYELYFQHSIIPDEGFFQSLFMNSPYYCKRKDSVCYLDWGELKSSPKVLTSQDFDKLIMSGKWIARKFDEDIDSEILNKLMGAI